MNSFKDSTFKSIGEVDATILAKKELGFDVTIEELIAASKVFHAWKYTKASSEVIRSGYGMYGVYPFDVNHPIDEMRAESVCEHSAGVVELMDGILCSPELRPKFIMPDIDRYLLKVARVHDIPERLCGGDVPDDGRRDEVAKDAAELDAIQKVLANYIDGDIIFNFYVSFQRKESNIGQFLYCADKFEAPLMGLYYESCGRGGDMKNKANPSDRDIHQSQLVDSTKLADIWAYGIAHVSNQFELEVVKPYLLVLYVACREIRGHWFPWWESQIMSNNSN